MEICILKHYEKFYPCLKTYVTDKANEFMELQFSEYGKHFSVINCDNQAIYITTYSCDGFSTYKEAFENIDKILFAK